MDFNQTTPLKDHNNENSIKLSRDLNNIINTIGNESNNKNELNRNTPFIRHCKNDSEVDDETDNRAGN